VGQDVGPNTAFEDFWVFDLDPAGSGSVSADFTMLTGITGFIASLGSACSAWASCCAAIEPIAREPRNLPFLTEG